MSKKMMREMMLYMPAKIFEGIAGFAMIALYTRMLGEDGYGQFGLMNTLMLTANLVFFGWLMHATNRNIVSLSEEEKKPFLSTVLTTWLVLQLAYFALVGILCWAMPSWRFWLIYSLLLFSPFAGVQLLTPMMTFTKHIRASIALSAGTLGMKLLLVFIASRFFDPWLSIIGVHCLVDLVAFCLVLWRSTYLKYWRFSAWNWVLLKDFIAYGLPLVGLGIAMSVINMSARFLIGIFSGDAANGVYQVNSTVATTVFTLLQMSAMRAANPNIIAQYRQDPNGIEKVIWQGLRLFWLLALPACAGITLLATPILERIVEKKFIVGYAIVGWIAVGMLVLGTVEYITKPLELTRDTKPVLRASVIAAAVNLGLNLWLIPKVGYTMAAISTMVAYVIYGAYLTLYVIKRHRIYIDVWSFAKLLAATGIMSVIVAALAPWVASWWQLITVIGVAMVVYFGILTITGELKQELAMFTAKIRRT